jgi:CDP-diglyceride synthetase
VPRRSAHGAARAEGRKTKDPGLAWRVVSAVLFLPLFVWAVSRGGLAFHALWALIIAIGAVEAVRLFARLGGGRSNPARWLLAILLAAIYPVGLGAFVPLLRAYEPPAPLYLMPSGVSLVYLLFLSTWSCDTVAYFAGRAFGRHKLAPSVSPH